MNFFLNSQSYFLSFCSRKLFHFVFLKNPDLSGVIFTNFITSKIDFNSKVVFDTEELEVNTTPSIRSVLLIILLPLILIIFRSLLDTGILSITNETVSKFIKFIGHPFSALIIANIIAWYFLGIRHGIDKKKLDSYMLPSFTKKVVQYLEKN